MYSTLLLLSLLYGRRGDRNVYSESKSHPPQQTECLLDLSKSHPHASQASSEAGFRAQARREHPYLRTAPEVIQGGQAQVWGRGSWSWDTVSNVFTVRLPWGQHGDRDKVILVYALTTEDLLTHTALARPTSTKTGEKEKKNDSNLYNPVKNPFILPPSMYCTQSTQWGSHGTPYLVETVWFCNTPLY